MSLYPKLRATACDVSLEGLYFFFAFSDARTVVVSSTELKVLASSKFNSSVKVKAR